MGDKLKLKLKLHGAASHDVEVRILPGPPLYGPVAKLVDAGPLVGSVTTADAI